MEGRGPLKVLMIASSYPRSQGDTAGIFLRYLAEHLFKRGVSVHVLAPADKRAGTSIEGDVTIHRFQYLPGAMQQLAYGSGILHNLRANPWLWMEVPLFLGAMSYSLTRLARREKPDLLHAHWVVPQGLAGVYTKRWHHAPVVTTAHGNDAFRLRRMPFNILKRKVLRRSAAWTANSHATAQAIDPDATVMPPHIIPMGVDVERFQNGRRSHLRSGFNENDFILLFVGRLVEAKGVDHLLRALALLPSMLLHRTTLWVVGEGRDLSRLKSFAHRLGIEQRVRFWGQIKNDLLPDFYAAADLLVAPATDPEGQGVVLAEAFAARLCVLATRVGGIREVVEDGVAGMLVEPGDAQALARGIENLLTEPELRQRFADSGFLRARSDYAWEKIAARFEELYHWVIEGQGKKSC